jgi:hypothetical protein
MLPNMRKHRRSGENERIGIHNGSGGGDGEGEGEGGGGGGGGETTAAPNDVPLQSSATHNISAEKHVTHHRHIPHFKHT